MPAVKSWCSKLGVNYGQSLDMGPWSIIGIMGHFTTIFALKLMKLFSHLLRQNAINIQNRLLWHLNWWRHRGHKKIANCTRRKDISIFRKELEIESNTLSAFWIALITFTFFLFLFWFFFFAWIRIIIPRRKRPGLSLLCCVYLDVSKIVFRRKSSSNGAGVIVSSLTEQLRTGVE